MGDLEPLNKIGKGSIDPNSSRQLTEAVRQGQQVYCINYNQPGQNVIMYKTYSYRSFVPK